MLRSIIPIIRAIKLTRNELNAIRSGHVTMYVTPFLSIGGIRSITPEKGAAYQGTGGTIYSITHFPSKRKENYSFNAFPRLFLRGGEIFVI